MSLRQLTVFGRSLTEDRLISSANYVRTELPTRIAHRLRDMQTLPYVVITNPHMSHVYNLYHNAFDQLRRLPEVKTIQDNEQLCELVRYNLKNHMSVIPRLVMGVLECQHLLAAERIDELMNTLLRARISRRVIAEQHLALTHTFQAAQSDKGHESGQDHDMVGQVFLRCHAKSIVERCSAAVKSQSRQVYGSDVELPEIEIKGHLDATFMYIPSHLEYTIGEILRNSMQAVVERRRNMSTKPPPIEVLICEAQQHVIFRISDQGGGVPQTILPYLWSFVKGPRAQLRLENLNKVPELSATFREIVYQPDGSLTMIGRPPNLRLGIGLPMSRVYAEYWAGSLELHNLEGFGVDTFLQISKLGNKNEQLSTRAAMDAL